MTWHLAGGTPDSVAGLTVEECKPGNAPRLLFSAMDAGVATEIERAFAAGRSRRGLQFAQSSHGAGRAADRPRNQSRSPEARPRPAAPPRLEGADRHQSQLLHHRPRHGSRTDEAVRHHQGPRHHHAGHLRRRLPGRRVHGHHGQRHSLHRQRRRKDGDGDAEDHGRVRRRSHRAARPPRSAPTATASPWSMATPKPSPWSSPPSPRRPTCGTRSIPSPPSRSSAICRAPRPAPSSTWTRPTARSRARTPSASAAWRPSSDACAPAPCSITSSSCSATTPSAAPPAPPCLNAELMHSEGMLD